MADKAEKQPGSRGWFWNILTYLITTAGIVVGIDLLLRLIKVTPDILGTLIFVLELSISAVLAKEGAGETGRKNLTTLMKRMKLPPEHWKALRFFLVSIFVLLLFIFYNQLPGLAVHYNNKGLAQYQQGLLKSAENDYLRAINLDPDYTAAHYNLGLLYEEIGDRDRAVVEYRLAMIGGLDAAYNNLAHLYILEDKPDQAVPLLLNGLDLTTDEKVLYSLYKNLGWARHEQERYIEAENSLRKAIDLSPDQAAAHCLLARTLYSMDKSSLGEWESCLVLADGRNADEDVWIGLARQRIMELEEGE
jgi:tetratricopeptide (TPR) repeat protein